MVRLQVLLSRPATGEEGGEEVSLRSVGGGGRRREEVVEEEVRGRKLLCLQEIKPGSKRKCAFPPGVKCLIATWVTFLELLSQLQPNKCDKMAQFIDHQTKMGPFLSGFKGNY